MAEVKTVELKVTTNIPDASKKIDGLKTSIDGAKESTKDLKKETETVSEGGFNKLGNSLSNLSPAFKSGIEGARSLGVQLLALAANPIGATILAVVGAVTLLYKAFASTNDGADKLEQLMAGLGAVLDVLRDRVLSAGNAIAKFFSGDFKGALSEAKKSVSGFGGEIEKEFKQAATAKRYLQEVEDSLRSLSVSRAKLNRDLAKSKEIITDENASYAQKKKAIEEVRVAEEKQTQAELRNAEKKLKAIKLANSQSDISDENLDKQARAEAELYALQEKSATDKRAIRRIEIRADREEQARLKEAADARIAKQKEEAEAKKVIDKEQEERDAAKNKLQREQSEKSREDLENIERLDREIRKKNLDATKSENELKVEAENADYERKKNLLISANLSTEELDKLHKENLNKLELEYWAKQSDLSTAATAKEKENSEKRRKISDEEFKAKQLLLGATADGLSALSDIMGKETGKGKALAVAASLINTYSAIAGQLRAFAGVPIPGYAIVQAIATGLAGFAAVKNILKVQVPNSTSSASVPSSSGISASTSSVPSAPTFNVVGTSGQNQIAQSLGNQQPLKAYVVANDVSSQQSLDRNIVKTATLGN